jgi:hypothetical protein
VAVNFSNAVGRKKDKAAAPHVSIRGLAMEDGEDLDLSME